VSAVLFGLVPALRGANLDLQTELKDGHSASTGLTAWRGRQRARQLLVVAELTLSVVLLVGAGLLIRSFGALQRVPTGFNPERVLTMGISLTGRKYTDTAKVQAAFRDVWPRLARLPGVSAAG